jgi:hypothetical protein
MSNQVNFKHRAKQTIFYRLFDSTRQLFRLKRDKAEKGRIKVELKQKNIQNLKTLLNREELLESLPQQKIVAELGVDHGDFSELILKITSPQKLHLIDVWEGGRYHNGLNNIVETKFKKEIDNGLVEMNIGFSTSVLLDFPDKYFDWVYLDTDHSYKTTKEELAILKLKVKPDGIIAGHDYTIGNWVDHNRYGVIEAVNEFCVNEGWEIIYLTVESDHYRSFAIQKLSD